MASKQIIAYGAAVERSTDDGATWARYPECKGVAVPNDETDYEEVTNLDSPNRRKEYIAGLVDSGTVSLPMGYTSDGYAMVAADKALNRPILYRVTLAEAVDQATGDMFEFEAFPTPKLDNSGVGSVVDMTVDLRITGDVQFTAGTKA